MFDVEVFIEEVRKRPALYNPNHEHYNRKEIKIRLWNEMGEIMFYNWKCLDDKKKGGKLLLMQKKWKSLKDCFNRELRYQRLQPNKMRKQYEFYNRLSFLLNKRNPEPLQSTHDLGEIVIKTETSEVLQASNPPMFLLQEPPTIHENLRKRKVPDVEIVRNACLKQDKRPNGAEDSDRLFLMSLVNDLSKLPLSTKYWVKMKFSEIMHQAMMSLDKLQDTECNTIHGESCEDENGGLDHPDKCHQLTVEDI